MCKHSIVDYLCLDSSCSEKLQRKTMFILETLSLYIYRRPSGVPVKPTASSYTNPAYFIFEGVSVPKKVEEALPHRRDPQVIWSGNEALQLPKVSGRQDFNSRPCRRSDFTEIEIPAILSQCNLTKDLHSPQTNTSYQLFPAKTVSPIPPPSRNAIPQLQEQASQIREKYQGKLNVVQDSMQHVNNMYINHSEIIKKNTRGEMHQLLPGRGNVIQAKSPSLLPYTPAPLTHSKHAVSWIVDKQPPTGDNSLTALQMAKSLSEVDFFPSKEKGPSTARQRVSYGNGPSVHGNGGYGWDKEVKSCLETLMLNDATHYSFLYKVLLDLNAGVSPERCTRNGAGASQYPRSSKVHPGTQPQWLGWSGLFQVKDSGYMLLRFFYVLSFIAPILVGISNL